MNPVQIDVFFPIPEGWGMCNACEVMMAQADLGQASPDRGLDEYPPEWQADFKRLIDTIYAIADHYQEQVQIRVWDPRSFQGLVKSIRYGVRRYPTFIINGHTKITELDSDQLEQKIGVLVESNNSAL
jgi:hypothetical protein